MEQLGLRYATERIHLQGDPREPPKQEGFLRDVNPSGGVPVLKIGDELVNESLDILLRLERDFADEAVVAAPDDEWVRSVVGSSGAFDCDGDAWLQNIEPAAEEQLRAESRRKLTWLEETLGAHAGPFFLGERASRVDAAFVGFLTRLDTNYRFFKQLDVRDPSAGCPRLAAWLVAMEGSRGGAATMQDAGTDQRVHQAHPARRNSAEPCMGLHPTTLGVGEASDWNAQLQSMRRPEPPLAPGSPAALEAALRLHQRRSPLAGFLLRKAAEAAAGEGYWQGRRHPKASANGWAPKAGGGVEWTGARPPPYGPTDQSQAWPPPDAPQGDAAALDSELLALALTLVGKVVEAAFSSDSPINLLGGLIGTPRDMSSAAAAQVRAALAELGVVPAAGAL